MIALEDAQAHILARCPTLDVIQLPLAQARSLVLAEPIVAKDNVPAFANSAMDGFAVRAGDTATAPARFSIVGTLAAGGWWAGSLETGQALRIMTGAPVPDGADAVVMVELTSTENDETPGDRQFVDVHTTARRGDNIRLAGSDISAGQRVFETGEVLSAGHLGVLASLGKRTVSVVRPVRVGVLSTGDELIQAGDDRGVAPALRPGQIRDSNRTLLLAKVSEAGFEAVDLGIVADDAEAIAAAISDGIARCDALVTSGGVSVGDFDHVKGVLDRLGRMWWWQVAIRPAKPLAFGLLPNPSRSRDVPVFGLPGNPVSSMVSFELFAAPALRQMSGHGRLRRAALAATAEVAIDRRPDGKLHLVRVTARVDNDGGLHVRPTAGQGSHMLAALAHSDALALVPDGLGIAEGGVVRVITLGSLWV